MLVVIAVRFSGLIECVPNFVLAIDNDAFFGQFLDFDYPNNVPDVFTRLLGFRIWNLLKSFEIFGALSFLSAAVQPMLLLLR